MNTKTFALLAALALLSACAKQADTSGAARQRRVASTSGCGAGQRGRSGGQCRRPRVLRHDRTRLSGDARGTLDRQSAWLGRTRRMRADRRQLRRARHRGIQHRPGRTPCQRGPRLPRGPWRLRPPASRRSATARIARPRSAPTRAPISRTATRSPPSANRAPVGRRRLTRRRLAAVCGRDRRTRAVAALECADAGCGCVLAAALLIGGPALAQMDSRDAIALQNQILELRQRVQTLQQQRGGARPRLPRPTAAAAAVMRAA